MIKQKLSTGPGLIIGFPTLGRPVPFEWAMALKSMSAPINYNIIFHRIKGQEIGKARQEMALNAIKSDAKYLFFVGDDVVIPDHALRSMIYKLDNNDEIGVIGGVYCVKADPSFPLVFRGNGQGSYWDWKIGEFFEVTGLGMDCTIIRVSLLKELHEKGGDLFKTVKSDKFLDGVNAAEEWTEDLFFLDRVSKETKFKIYCDGGIICQHWDVYADKYYTLPKDSLPLRTRIIDGELKKLLDIGGQLPPQEGFNVITAGDMDGVDYRCDPTSTPFENEDFDAVNSSISIKSHTNVHPLILESFRILKSGGIFKFTHSEAFNTEWLTRVCEANGFTDVKCDGGLIEMVKK